MNSLVLTTHERLVSEHDPAILKEANIRIHHALQAKGQSVFARYFDLVITLQGTTASATIDNHSLNNFDCIVPRSTTFRDFDLQHGYLAQLVTQVGLANGKRVLNGSHFLHFPHDFNKMFQMVTLHQHHLPIPDSTLIANPINFIQAPLPAIVKPNMGSKGFNIRKAETIAEIPDVTGDLLFQQVLPHNYDYRIIVMNDECIGVMKRTASEGSIVSNFSAGGAVEPAELTTQMKEIALAAAKVFELEYCGVDLMLDEQDQLHILEVNRFASFIGFQQATGIDVAQKLADYLEKTL